MFKEKGLWGKVCDSFDSLYFFFFLPSVELVLHISLSKWLEYSKDVFSQISKGWGIVNNAKWDQILGSEKIEFLPIKTVIH